MSGLEQRKCIECNAIFEAKTTSSRIVCGDKCRGARKRTQSKERLSAKPKALCLWCGSPILRNQKDKRHKDGDNKFCSHKCNAEYRLSLMPVCPDCGRRHAGGVGELCCDCQRNNEHELLLHKTCEICGIDYVGLSAQSKRCSPKCDMEWAKQKAKAYGEKKFLASIKPRQCMWCGKVFTPEYGSKRRAYCNTECQDAAAIASHHVGKRLRKARMKVLKQVGLYEPISLYRLYIRDNGTCQICKRRVRWEPVKNKADIVHAMSATRDHIIPISCGGTHTWDNIRLAHLSCNSARGIGGSAQMLLFG